MDIIAVQLNPERLNNDKSIWNAISIEFEALDVYMMKLQGIDEGWLVLHLVFPMNLVSDVRAPICRLGCISRVTDTFLDPDRVKYFLVDAQTFPGNSGGPIVSKPENVLFATGVNPIPARQLRKNKQGGNAMVKDALFPGESKNIEYKVSVPDKSEKYMKTVVAFANGSGGRIVFGIDDKTLDVVGIDSEHIFRTMDSVTNAISDACEPRIRPEVTLQTIEDKTIIVVDIFPGAMRPYYIKAKGMAAGTYVRVSGTTRLAEGYLLKELILEGQNRYYDSEPCRGMSVTDAEVEKLCRSMKETALKNTWQASEKAKIKDITKNVLISWGILAEENGTAVPTNAYALLAGTLPMQPVIQCGVFKGTDRAYFVDRREFGGPVQEQADAAYQYVLEKINMGMKMQGIYRQDVYELPADSVRELIANAVAHRSYLDPGNIQVAVFDDRLEVTSPGMLLNNVSIPKIKEGYSKPRNPAIARAFAYMKIIEKWGTGISRIFRECREYGLPEPELIDFGGDFKVNMYRRQKGEFGVNVNATQTTQTHQTTQHDVPPLSEDDKAVLALVQRNPEMTQKEYAQELGWTVDRVKYYLRKMKMQQMISRVGSIHNGHWEVLIEWDE